MTTVGSSNTGVTQSASSPESSTLNQDNVGMSLKDNVDVCTLPAAALRDAREALICGRTGR
eukprot:CAMPEP_0179414296 /NCGR_PEP_ID=MMETSP0799-20121207/5585_1 /TAXON_ID=46947 /ORGANISM="Geminigera cryophila, Strain CCMP2564" /LENGTH=60 /DNA_ID=CAMNT_0021186883 /DNA_START=1080 /DNA_END=1259 /DNA_ORIENTATION=+